MFNRVEQQLLNDWQRDLPLESRPYACMASKVGITEAAVIDVLADLKQQRAISRVGAVVRPGTIGASTLATMAVPTERLEEVADTISSYHEVNHNYERDHHFNLWFVVTASNADALAGVLATIERGCELPVMNLPLVEAYHIDLGFDLRFQSGDETPDKPRTVSCKTQVDEPDIDATDCNILWQMESGLPLTPQPYAKIGDAVGLTEGEVIYRLGKLIEMNVIRRLGVIVRHHEVGYGANAMVVWDVPDTHMDEAVRRLTSDTNVTLCYQRPRRLPDWPYNLFSMIHGTSEESVRYIISKLRSEKVMSDFDCDILFSRRRFKQTGARYQPDAMSADTRDVA